MGSKISLVLGIILLGLGLVAFLGIFTVHQTEQAVVLQFGAIKRVETEPGLKWTEKRFVTRLLDGGPDRVTLLTDRIKIRRNGTTTEEPISTDEWDQALRKWFGMTP